MARGLRDIVKFGVELVSPGTLAASMALTQPIVGDGFKPVFTDGLGQINSSATFPYDADQVPVGVTVAATLTPEINVNTIRDLVLFATKRTSGDLPFLSIQHLHQSISGSNAQMSYLGGVCNSLRLSFSRGGSPGGESVLTGSLGFDFMGFATATGLTGGTQAVGRRFQVRQTTFTVDGTSEGEILNCEINVTNALDLGTVNSSNVRGWIEHGLETTRVTLTRRLATVAWRDLARAQTEHAVAIVLGTGTANETVTLTIGKAQLAQRTIAQDGGVLTEQVDIVPYHTGSAAPCVWTFGSSIGASALSL